MTGRVQAVRAGLEEPEPEARRLAVLQLPTLPAPEACDLLLVALGDGDWRVRKEAASVCSRIEPRTAVVFAVARALAERDNVGLRNAAVEALVGIGPDAVAGAIDALSRLDADGRKLAVEVLAGAPTLAGMRALARATNDADVNVVVAAAEALGQAHLAGDEARELAAVALTVLLDRPETDVRLAALESMSRLEAEVPWARLEPLFADPLLRRNAIGAAAGNPSPRAMRALAEACADPSATMSLHAVVALGRSIEATWGKDELLDVVAKTLRSSSAAKARLRALAKPGVEGSARSGAVLALGLVRDPDDVSLLVEALTDEEVAERAEAALHLFGQEATGPLLVAGRSAVPSLRGATISMLQELAPRDPEPLLAVREALTDPSTEVLAAALKSLTIVGTAEDLPAAAKHVTSADAKVAVAAQAAVLALATKHPAAARASIAGVDARGDAALAAARSLDGIARAGQGEPADMAFLGIALNHRHAAIRRAAIDALASLGAYSNPATTLKDEVAETIGFCLADEESVVAHAAIRALGRLGRAELLAALAATTKDPLRLGAVLRALCDADPARAFAAARPLLRSRESALATAAVEVVGATRIDGHVEALMGAADHPDHEVVKVALSRLARTGDERALAALARAIDHDADNVRRYAAELLGQESGTEAESLLRGRLDRERSAEVRRAIMEALSRRPDPEGSSA